MQNPNRNAAIDALRAFVTLLVLAHHAFLAYASFVPSATAAFTAHPYFWAAFPVVDLARWRGFDVFILFNDSFFMALMFLIAGLFVWPSLTRKGEGTYLRDRGWRLGLPFLGAAFLLAPLAYYPAYAIRSGAPSLTEFFQLWLSLDNWPSGPCWFIASLLAFDLLAAATFRLWPGATQAARRIGEARALPQILGLLLVSGALYLALVLVFGPSRWIAAGPFAIQASRILLYASYFLTGVCLGAYGLNHGLLAPAGKLAKFWLAGIAAALLAFILNAATTIHNQALGPQTPVTWQALAGIAYALSCAGSSLLFLAVFIRFVRRDHRILRSISANAYGMYLIHYPIVIWLQYSLLHTNYPAFEKGIAVFVLTALLSWSLAATLRRIPIPNALLTHKRQEFSPANMETTT